MRLYEVGPKPIVSARGVSFDTNHPDRYTFISPAIELLETLDFDSEREKQHIHKPNSKPYSQRELIDKVKSYCKDIENLLDTTKEKTKELIKELKSKVDSNSRLSPDEKRAWLGNISTMEDYYLQYITNETVYRCLLDRLADKFLSSHIESITFPLKNHYGLVLDDLIKILQDHKPPYDAEIKIEKSDEGLIGKFTKYRGKNS